MMVKPNFIIISGNGRNTGKTSFVESIIRNNSAGQNLTAIKVSPHFHPAEQEKNIIISNDRFRIRKETSIQGSKDSSRMLRAGASSVFYIEAKDDQLAEAMHNLIETEDLRGPVICESGGMRMLVKPSLFIVLTRQDINTKTSSFKELSPLADMIVHFDNETFDHDAGEITYTGIRWELRNQRSDSEFRNISEF